MPKLFFLQNYKKLVVVPEKQIMPFNLLHIGGVFLNVQKTTIKNTQNLILDIFKMSKTQNVYRLLTPKT